MPEIRSEIIEMYIFRRNADATEYLLLQRTREDCLYPCMWQIITGTLEDRETAVQCALRELNEETGLKYKRLWAVPATDSFYDYQRDIVQVMPVFAAEVDREAEPELSREHQMFEWLPFDNAREKLVWPGQRSVLEIVHQYIAGREAASLLSEIKQA
ncbi:MAG: NUDIX domain-containing protein [Bacteroidota bacterium]